MDPSDDGDAGVPHGRVLLDFASAANRRTADVVDRAHLADARVALVDALGEAAMREAAATVAIFNGLVRVADGTGIQLDNGMAAASVDIRGRLDLDRMAGAANTSQLRPVPRSVDDVRGLFA